MATAKKKEPIFGGPLGKALTSFDYSSLKGAATRANAERRNAAQATPKPQEVKPMAMKPALGSKVEAARSQGFATAVKAAKPSVTATASKPAPSKPAASTAQTFGAAFAAARKSGLKQFEYKGKKYTTAMKGEAPKAAAPMARQEAAPIAKMESKPAQTESKEPVMAKREVKIETPEKKKRLLAMLRERAKGRKPSGMNPMGGFSVATASDYLEGGKGKTMMGGGMVKKYMGGGKMEEYKKGGKMDKKKAFMEMIAKLKSKKK